MSYQPNEPLVKNGKVHYKYEMNDSINLDGEWLFYKDKWVLPTRDKIKTSQTIEVPQSWNRHFTKNQDEYKGTYYLKSHRALRRNAFSFIYWEYKGIKQYIYWK